MPARCGTFSDPPRVRMLDFTAERKRDDRGIEVMRHYGPTATCARQSGLVNFRF
jgi:hypothetical protein